MLLEATAAMMLTECFAFYHGWISELCSSCQSSARIGVAQSVSDIAPLFGRPSVMPQQVQHGKITWALEAFFVNILDLSLVLVEQDESGMQSSFGAGNVESSNSDILLNSLLLCR